MLLNFADPDRFEGTKIPTLCETAVPRSRISNLLENAA